VDELLSLAGDQLAESLDALHGAELTDQSIYRAHAAKYEVRSRCDWLGWSRRVLGAAVNSRRGHAAA